MYYIGIDLGGTNIAAGIVNENYEIIAKGSVPTGADRDGEAIIADMGKLCNDLMDKVGITGKDVAYAGIASPGSVNPATGYIEYANNLPFFKFPIVDILKKTLKVDRIYIENDANAAAYGESLAGASKGAQYSVMITLGTGVGGGIIWDGKIYSGFNYAGAELGHIVIKRGGRQCSCGRKGCFEAYSSATGLITSTKEAMEAHPDSLLHKAAAEEGTVSGKTAFVAMRMGDEVAKQVVDEYITDLACGLANIINIFQPNILCIGGGICHEGDALLVPLLEKIGDEVYNKAAAPENKTKIRMAQLGNDAGIIGAAMLGNYMK